MGSHNDVIIIGAGIAGLSLAKTYIQIEPQVNLLILDDKKTIGGVWAKEKLYPGLRTNNQLGTYEFSDFPMHEGFGVKKGQHIPGIAIHEYLNQYAEKFNLLKRIAFQKLVDTVEQIPEGWRLRLTCLNTNEVLYYTCSKLMVATGLTSRPSNVHFDGSESFEKPIIQFASLAEKGSQLLADSSIKHVTVFGGGKAASDAVYLFGKGGKSVTWVIRKSGYGPLPMVPSHLRLGFLKFWTEKLTTTRVISWFSPCIWGDADSFGYVRSLLHGTTVGRWIVDSIWKQLNSEIISQGVGNDEKTEKLIPNDNCFWYSTNMGILNYPTNFYDLVTGGQVKVLKKDLDHLDGSTLKFEDGSVIETDLIVSSMGWKYGPSFDFLPKRIHSDLGIPSRDLTKTQKEMWDHLDAQADAEILERFPKLKNGPRPEHRSPLEYPPWRLWRGAAPPGLSEKNILFAGMLHNYTGTTTAEILGLWAYAYLNDKLSEPTPLLSNRYSGEKTSPESRFYDAALFNRNGVWRSPYGLSKCYPDFVFDGVPYYDLLLRDLGLNNWRKGWGGPLGEIFGGSYGVADYAGLVDEWLKNQKDGQG